MKLVAALLIILAISLKPAGAIEANGTPIPVFVLALLEQTSVDETEDAICISGKRYQGCCSGRRGIKDIRGEWIECNDETTSPTCGGIDVDLSGCCKGKNGVALVDSQRRVICESGEESPTCSISRAKKDEC